MEATKITINNNMEKNKNMTRIIINMFLILLVSSLTFAQSMNNSDVNTSNLGALNIINVTIGGDFPMSGTYPASRTERVDQLVTRILVEYKGELLRTTPDEQLLGLLKSNIDDYAKRNIILKRFSGDLINIDLVKFRLTGDFSNNPYLNNDDVLIFPPLDLDRNFVQISGAVNKEIKFEFVEGERLSDAIMIAHGLNLAYTNVDSVEISRLSYDGQSEDVVVAHINENPPLERGDRIRVLADETRKRDYSVLVLGEVKRPGRVYITKNSTNLSDVISKVGGFTSNASLKFSELIRNLDSYSTLKKQVIEENFDNIGQNIDIQNFLINLKQQEFLKMYRAADLIIEDTLFFSIDNSLRGLNGYSELDFRNLLDEESYESEYLVTDKDVIIVPKNIDDIYVWGGVRKTGNYKYQKDSSIWDYINLAGGLTDIAYGDDEIYLIKGKSRDWIHIEDEQNLIIEAGDFIYVKKEVPRDAGYYIYRVAQYASIFGSIATVILLLNQIGK